MKVSILLLSYNQAPFIERAIQSIVGQKTTYSFEILISDDCSSDNSQEIIKRYASLYPNLIVPFFQSENIGPKNNDRFLFDKSKGQYICYCEADDYWCDDYKIQKQISFLEQNPEFGLVHTDVNHYYIDDKSFIEGYNKTKGIEIKSGWVFDQVMVENHYIKTMTVCYRKQILLDEYFSDEVVINANWTMVDLSQWLCIAHNSKIHYLDEVTATYCLRSESMSRSKSKVKLHAFHMDIFDIRYHFAFKYNISGFVLERINNMYVKMLIGDAYHLSDLGLLRKGITSAWRFRVFLNWKDLLRVSIILFNSLFKRK